MCTKSGTAKGLTSSSSSSSPTSVCASGHILLVSMQKLRNPAFQRFGADLRKTLMITSVVKQARKFYQLGSDVPVNCGCVRAESVFVLPMPAVVIASSDEVEMTPLQQEQQPVAATPRSSTSDEDDDDQRKATATPIEQVTVLPGTIRTATPEPKSSSSSSSSSRKHSLSLLRKRRGPKNTLNYIAPVNDDANKSPSQYRKHPVTPDSNPQPQLQPPNNDSHRHHNHHHYHQHHHNYQIAPSHHISYEHNHGSTTSSSNNDHPISHDQPQQQQRYQHQDGEQGDKQTSHIAVVPRYFQLQSDDTPPVKKRRLTAFLHEPNAICITATVC